MKKCDWCGRYYTPSGMLAKDAEHLGDLADKAGLGLVTSLGGGLMRLGGKRNFCSEECKQNYMAAHQGEGGGGATGGVMSGVMSGQKQAMAQQKQMMANHREAVHAIRDFDFPSDDAGFYKAAISITDDYSTCSVCPFWDRDYRAAYKKRIKRELKGLKGSNQERYEKLLEAYNDAKAVMRKKVIVRSIIGAVIALVMIMVAANVLQSDDSSGAIIGLCVGFVAFWFPFLVGRPKQQEE